ncbi:MAG TPA: PIN domain-containing protein [Pseudonocardiaceae bacterium]|nr:PIN domain-containing protein [Pseudonocardiaceae bacterium]
MIVCDTAPLVAAALYRDPDHQRCVDMFTDLRLANRHMLLPTPIIAEVGYLLGAKAGARARADFLHAVSAGDFVPVKLTAADHTRMAELVDEYTELALGRNDASVIALAERLDIDEVATLDYRHFTSIRPRHVKTLTLLP